MFFSKKMRENFVKKKSKFFRYQYSYNELKNNQLSSNIPM